MEISFYLSILAILISCISLIWSIYVGYRDRGNIKATSNIKYINITNYSKASPSTYPILNVKAVNCGRRPVILSMFGADYADGTCNETYIEKRSSRLSENEKYEITIVAGDSKIISPERGMATDCWFEDTLGRRYKVKNAEENLKKTLGRGIKKLQYSYLRSKIE